MAPEPPTELKYEEKYSDSSRDDKSVDVQFLWKPPLNPEQQVNSYTVTVSSFISPKKEYMLSETEIFIRNLEKDVMYAVSVTASNCGGTSRSTSIKGNLPILRTRSSNISNTSIVSS